MCLAIAKGQGSESEKNDMSIGNLKQRRRKDSYETQARLITPCDRQQSNTHNTGLKGFDYVGTAPTFNSCTKCMGNPGIIQDRTPDCHPVP